MEVAPPYKLLVHINKVYTVYTDPKTVMGSKFDQGMVEKIAHQFIAPPDLANCMSIS